MLLYKTILLFYIVFDNIVIEFNFYILLSSLTFISRRQYKNILFLYLNLVSLHNYVVIFLCAWLDLVVIKQLELSNELLLRIYIYIV